MSLLSSRNFLFFAFFVKNARWVPRIKVNNFHIYYKKGECLYMKRLFKINLRVWKMIKENKILSMALIVFITFAGINSLLIYNFVQVLERI